MHTLEDCFIHSVWRGSTSFLRSSDHNVILPQGHPSFHNVESTGSLPDTGIQILEGQSLSFFKEAVEEIRERDDIAV